MPAGCPLFWLTEWPVEATDFHLYARAKHVFSEALRVLRFRDMCLESRSSPHSSAEKTLQALGELMNESHKSCSESFDCSCPELDDLTALARASGAYGSRLTGAGWGGCTVSLVGESEVEEFKNKLKDGYPKYRGATEEELNEMVFATNPSSGAFGMFLVLGPCQEHLTLITNMQSSNCKGYSASKLVGSVWE